MTGVQGSDLFPRKEYPPPGVGWGGAERGAVLVVALVTLGLLSVLGGAWLRVVTEDRETVVREEREILARSLADAGVERVLAWFADPASFVGPGVIRQASSCAAPRDQAAIFRKRCLGAGGLPSFRGVDGSFQFVGTATSPDLVYAWNTIEELSLDSILQDLNLPGPSLRSLVSTIRMEIRLLAPQSPDAIATILSRASIGEDATATVRAELIDGPWRGISEAIHAGAGTPGSIPIRVHWGDIFVDGPLDMTTIADRLPRRDPDTMINGQPYILEPGADRWLDLRASGTVSGPLAPNGQSFLDPYAHVHQNVPQPGPEVWGYRALKSYAQRHGRYVTTRGTGLLYENDQGPGVPPNAVFTPSGNTRSGVLFIDTLDQQPPRLDNLEQLRVEFDFAQADAFVGAHLVITGAAGRSVVVDTPPEDGNLSAEPAVRGITLSGIHYVGALLVAGQVRVENRVNVFGAIKAGQGFDDVGGLEIWYDGRLAQGYRKGFAPVLVKPGSRRRVVPETPPTG
ncbi:MAG: hypothetical protein HY207_00540 [Nitrospirae bacterium]|nr:hypothetical protein [Nitrospirota bacterium]